MLCPDCKHNAFEPEFAEMPSFALADHPLFRNTKLPPIQVLRQFRCGYCNTLYFVCAGESAEQAYWRIIRDHAKD